MFTLKDLQILNTTTVFLNYAANVDDIFSKEAVKANFLNTSVIKDLSAKLEDLKLEIRRNPATPSMDPYYGANICHFIESKNIVQKLKTQNTQLAITNESGVVKER